MSEPFDNLPSEVAEQWQLLHEDAKARYKELSPSYTPALFVVGIVVVLLALGVAVLASGIFPNTQGFITSLVNGTVPETVTPTMPIPTATGTATATATATATGTATATAIATATANTVISTATTTATPTQDAEATEVAQALACANPSAYKVEIENNGDPRRKITLISESEQTVRASWVITNRSEIGCVWKDVKVQPLSGNEVITPILLSHGSNDTIKQVESGETVNLIITVPITDAASTPRIQWVLILNEVPLFGDEEQYLTVKEPWIIEGSETLGCDPNVEWVGEITQDGVVIQPSEVFTHTWAVKNVGDCQWNEAYNLRQVEAEGYEFEEPNTRIERDFEDQRSIIPLAEPNEVVEISLRALAPSASGTYTGTWHLYEGENKRLGVPADSQEPNFYVSLNIIVATLTPTPTPTQ